MAKISAGAIGLVVALALTGPVAAQGTPAQPDKRVEPRKTDKTVEALRKAYWTAVRSGDFYNKAARKADDEGVAGVASLMRAAAKVEAVHAANLAKALEEMEATKGKADEKAAPAVKATKENLATATELATAARETDLPAARKIAEGEGVREAARVFRDAREGEIELVRQFKDASELMDLWKKSKKDFFVGRTCGYLVEKLDLTKCPVCGKGRDDFEKVN
ncbi:MAG: ferritin family protein [Phycisphaerales bacterium]|nr:ferritin family protein [Phycisphaerales bacterium]